MTCWARFRTNEGRSGFGVLEGTALREYAGDPFDAPRPAGVTLEAGSYVLLPPCQPSKIIAVWNNFHALAAKLGKQEPERVLYLIKSATSLIGPGESIRRPRSYAGKIVYEGELGIVVGRRCAELSPGEAASAIFGYTCVNDVTAGDILNESPDFAQWCRAKSFDTFGCLGPVIATDFDWARAQLVTTVDGVVRQDYPLSDMIFSPATLVSAISHDMTLLPGDVIACGTSVGVGSMRDGSTVEVRIEGIGTLRNPLAPA